MKEKIKIELNRNEIAALVMVLFQYNTSWITNRNTRLMILELLYQLHKKLTSLYLLGGSSSRIISITQAQAAAFDQAFRQTPIPEHEAKLPLYEQTLINSILNQINIILI